MPHDLPILHEIPLGEYAFPGPLRDALVSAILDGSKTTTSSLFVEYGFDERSVAAVGSREAVVDSHGNIVCVTVIVNAQIVRLGDVTLAHAIAEGEGFTSVAEWREAHEDFWRSPEFVEHMGRVDLSDDALVVCETFTVDHHYPVNAPIPWDAE